MAIYLILSLLLLAMPAQANTRDGLVGWWAMDEASGDFQDSSSSGSVPTVTGTTALNNCPKNKCRLFDGVDDAGLFGAVTNLIITENISISTWFKANGDYTTAQALVAHSDSTGSNGIYAITLGLTDNKIEFWNNNAGPNIVSTASISDNNWRHIVATRSGSAGSWTLNIYINGVLDKTDTTAENPLAGGTNPRTAIGKFGNYTSGSTYYFNGNLDDVRIYNRAITAQEVKDLYNAGVQYNI